MGLSVMHSISDQGEVIISRIWLNQMRGWTSRSPISMEAGKNEEYEVLICGQDEINRRASKKRQGSMAGSHLFHLYRAADSLP